MMASHGDNVFGDVDIMPLQGAKRLRQEDKLPEVLSQNQ